MIRDRGRIGSDGIASATRRRRPPCLESRIAEHRRFARPLKGHGMISETTRSTTSSLPGVEEMDEPGPPLILASTSPRRRALLAESGFEFEVDAADIDESALLGEQPVEHAIRLALTKARVVAKRREAGLVIGADTIVIADGEILGKPGDADEARSMLLRLRGRRHLVITGVAVVDASSGASASAAEYTGVWMRDFTVPDLEAYIASGDPFDKAGGYGIQSQSFSPVSRLQGSACNVIGLPVALVRALLLRPPR